jgi:hypothetical protein
VFLIVAQALGRMLVEMQVAARLALQPPSSDREAGIAYLLQHVRDQIDPVMVRHWACEVC